MAIYNTADYLTYITGEPDGYAPYMTKIEDINVTGTVTPNIYYNSTNYTISNQYTTSVTTDNYRITPTDTGTITGYDESIYSNGFVPLYAPLNITGSLSNYYVYAPTKKDQERIRIKSNLCFQFKSRANPLQYNGIPESERRAMDTLREVISEEEFRKYLRYGFVLVRAKSGAVYQIFKNQSHTKVWVGGKMVEEVCIRIKDEAIPRTDRVVALKAIVETSEEEFKKLGNVYKMAA